MSMVPFSRYALEKGKIAILLATYNGEIYLPELLNSLLAQSFQDFCCFIHDDGSDDETIKIIKYYCERYPQKFVLVEGGSTGGAKSNFMYLLNQVEADMYMFCDQDDIWLPNKIELTYLQMKDQYKTMPVVVYTDLKIVDAELNIIDSSYYHYTAKNPDRNDLIDLLKSNVTVGCTMMINRILRNKALELDEIHNIFMHDWWISLIAAATGKLIFLNQPTILYRQHGNNSVGAIKKKSTIEKARQYMKWQKMFEKKKYNVQRPILFCEELSKVVGQECKDIDFIREYAAIEGKTKLERIKFYKHRNLFRSNSNVLWQILWI